MSERVVWLLGALAAVVVVIALIWVGVTVVASAIPKTNGALPTTADSIYVWHDDARSVTCWVYGSGYKGGLSCLPDSQVHQP